MQFSLDKSSKLPYYDQIKNQLTAALHMGSLSYHEQLPTVRALARVVGVNPKTILKIYHQLQTEGLVEVRLGSGVQVGAIERTRFERSYYASVVSMMERHLEEAGRMQFSEHDYLDLLRQVIDPKKRREITCLVVECNTEQIRLFAAEISKRIGITAHPVLMDQLKAHGPRVASLLSKASFLVTTDFHWEDVERIALLHHKIPLKIRLRPEFLTTLIQGARKGGVLMVVSNLDYYSKFRAALRDLGFESALKHIHAVLASDHQHFDSMLSLVKHVYVSPLCGAGVPGRFPPTIRRIDFPEHLSVESLNSLRTAIFIRHLQRVLPRPSLRPGTRPAA
ncbi:MAG: GntR family transcriptional regulator [Acidobacteriia bacterium]|nr:GntR family transcriptional regulator [Terriglobia bacterium]